MIWVAIDHLLFGLEYHEGVVGPVAHGIYPWGR
jgi:hypothetical protein